MDIVDRYNLVFLEDCCDALGSTYDGKELGSFGIGGGRSQMVTNTAVTFKELLASTKSPQC